MRNRLLPLLLMLGLLLVWVPGGAFADHMEPNCGTCSGSIYTPQFTQARNGAFDTFLIVNNSGDDGGGGWLLSGVPFEVSDQKLIDVSLLALPNDAGNWVKSDGVNDARGCDGAGSQFVCAMVSAGLLPSVPDGTFFMNLR